MKKREFIKSIGLAALAFSSMPVTGSSIDPGITELVSRKKIKNWTWLNPDPTESEDAMRKRFDGYFESGIHGVFFEADHEPAFSMAKSAGLEAHRWIWTMNRNDPALIQVHPEWYSINRNGESCADKPPYVNYYRWLCPSREPVRQYLADLIATEVAKNYVDGIHLDYIRYCDIFLPVSLWKNYNIIQTHEMPEYDYCYCSNCREKYQQLCGHDPMSIPYPSDSPSWLQFRLDQVSQVVSAIAEKVKKEHRKPISAAVFPTPYFAKRNVRQDWVNWPLEAVCPMIYHEFYDENINWIGTAVKDGVTTLNNSFPLYAGLYLPSFKSNEELALGIRKAFEAGAGGVSLFSNPGEEQLKTLKSVMNEMKK